MSENLAEIINGFEKIVPVEDKRNLQIVSNENREISIEDYPYTLSLRQKEISDPKDFKKFIRSCEGMVRNSPEYRIWTSFVREGLGHFTCPLTGEIHSQTKVELHHHPFGLFVITKAVITQYMASEKEFCSFDIATKIIELHYENRIGYIPIVSSLHEKFHNGYLFIPMNLIIGDWKYFLKTYSSFLEEEDLDTINSRLAINRDNCGWDTTHGYYWKILSGDDGNN